MIIEFTEHATIGNDTPFARSRVARITMDGEKEEITAQALEEARQLVNGDMKRWAEEARIEAFDLIRRSALSNVYQGLFNGADRADFKGQIELLYEYLPNLSEAERAKLDESFAFAEKMGRMNLEEQAEIDRNVAADQARGILNRARGQSGQIGRRKRGA